MTIQLQQTDFENSTDPSILKQDNNQSLDYQNEVKIQMREPLNQNSQINLNQIKLTQPKRGRSGKAKGGSISSMSMPTPSPFESFPRYSEIQKSLQTLRTIVPELFPDQFVDQIFSLSSRRLSQQGQSCQSLNQPKQRSHKLRKSKREQIPAQPLYEQPQKPLEPLEPFANEPLASEYHFEDYLIQDEVQLKHQFLALEDESQKQFNPIDLKKVIAKVYCEFGNNQELLQQAAREIAQQTQKSVCNYKKVLENILLNAFAKLESFLIQQCHQKVPSLIIEHGKKSLDLVLLDCTKAFTSENCQPFLNIIRGQYGLMNVIVTAEQARAFYQEVRNSLNQLDRNRQQDPNRPFRRYAIADVNEPQKKTFPIPTGHVFRKRKRVKGQIVQKGVRQMDEVRKLNRVWNHRYEMELIRSYRNYRTVGDIKSHFQQIFPQDSEEFSTLGLRSKLYTILRHAIRKFYTFIGKNEAKLPTMPKIGHNEIRWIIYNNEGAHIRLLLLSIYTSSQYDEVLIRKTIENITVYINEIHRNLKLSQMIEACKTSEKIKAKSGSSILRH